MFQALLDKLKLRRKNKPKTDEEIKKAKAKALEDAFIKAGRLKTLLNKSVGWTEFVEIIEEFIERCYIQKLETNFKEIMLLPKDSRNKALKELMLLDEDIIILRRMINAPKRFITGLESREKQGGVDE